MDINQCIDKLGLNANTYRLNKSNPPHTIIEWTGGDPEPSNAVLETAWAEIEAGLPMENWKLKMAESDGSLMPRYLEDLITDKFAGNAGTSLQERYDKKIKIRGERP